MTAKKHHVTYRFLSVLLAVVLSATMMTGFAKEVRADSATATYDAPTEPMEVDPNIITGTAHRAASPALDMMGLNAVSGFGMINGSAPTDLATASKAAAVGIWGTSINDNPDPYFWNYFYNFYVDANPDLGLVKSTDALMNPGVAASPMQADVEPRASFRTRSGCSMAISMAIIPPWDAPNRQTSFRPSARIAAAVSCAMSRTE